MFILPLFFLHLVTHMLICTHPLPSLRYVHNIHLLCDCLFYFLNKLYTEDLYLPEENYLHCF